MKYPRLSAIAVALPLALAACDNVPTAPASSALLPPARPSAALVRNDRTEINSVALSDCGTEDVLVTGTFHRVLTITADNAGGYHVNDHFDYTGLQGVGVITGTQYVASQVSAENFYISQDMVGFEVTQPLQFTLIGRGSAPNEVVSAIMHYTVNANGELTSFVDNFRVKCS